MHHQIQILSGNAFAGCLPVSPIISTRPIFKGNLTIGGSTITCYIKPLPDYIRQAGRLVSNREILNEALGYTLASRTGHAVPEQAGIIALDQHQIPTPALQRVQRLTPVDHPQQDYLAWFSADLKAPSLLENLGQATDHKQVKALVQRLAQHKQIPSIVALDDWMENTDRNLGNLLICGCKLALIDHGNLFRGRWEPARLKRRTQARNVIRELIHTVKPRWRVDRVAQLSLSVAWKLRGRAAAREVLTEFLDARDTGQVIDFLEWRLKHAIPT